MPLLASLGFIIYALVPTLLPQYAYIGLLIGTIIFSVSAGLNEVLISPMVAAIPSDHPDRDMSTLHSLYGYGSVIVVLISTGFLRIFGTENWMYLPLLFAIPPITASILLHLCPLPDIYISHASSGQSAKRRRIGLALCATTIFLGSATENTMTNWISIFMENALHLPKIAGDTIGFAFFMLLLALVRTWYAQYGKSIFNILLLSMIGSIGCYLVAGLSTNLIISVIACISTGLCASMLWPGVLILMEEKFPCLGVTAYALMAASGDFGASVAPQGMGIIVDEITASAWAARLSETLPLTAEQIGMKASMVLAAVFPILGTFVLLYMRRFFRKET